MRNALIDPTSASMGLAAENLAEMYDTGDGGCGDGAGGGHGSRED